MQSIQEQLLIYRLETTQDPEAFSELYSQYKVAIQRFIAFRVSNAEIADDLTAEVFLKIWHYVKERRRITHFRGLLYRIARNTVADHYRSARIAIPLEDVPEVSLELLEKDLPYVGPIDKERLLAAMGTMRPEYRELLMLFYFEQLHIKEIAVIVDKRSGAVRVQLHRALKAIRELLNEV